MQSSPRDPSPPDAAVQVLGLDPGDPLEGEIVVPGSKSIAQRVLICAGLSAGSVSIAGLPDGDDVRNACALIADCGALVQKLAPAAVHVRGLAPGPHRGWAPPRPVRVGESGTLARLATAALALCGRAGSSIEIHAEGSLTRRKSRALFATLRSVDVRMERVRAQDERADAELTALEAWPVKLSPLGPPSDVTLRDPGSSQEVSAFLIALAAYPDAMRLHVSGEIPSRPYVELTLAVLEEFGVSVKSSRAGDTEVFEVRGPLSSPTRPISVEPDASSAAVALAAACLSAGQVSIRGLGAHSRQGDLRLVEYLRHMGSRAGLEHDRVWAGGYPSHAIDVDLSGEPDLAPVLAALAAGAVLRAEGTRACRLSGLSTLAGKESSRIEVLARALRTLGFEVEAGSDFLTVAASARARERSRSDRVDVLEPDGDHRMAFVFALLGLVIGGVRVRNARCVSKSWPRFWEDMQRLGARVAR